MEEEQNQEQQEQQEQDQVLLHEASAEDIEAYLTNAQKLEPEVAKVEEGEVEQQEAQEEVQQTEQTPRKVETTAPEKHEATAKPRQYTQEEIAALEAENKRLQASNEQKELFIQRRNTELGEYRKKANEKVQQLLQRKKQLQEGLQDKFDQDPMSAIEDRDEIKGIDQELVGINEEGKRAEKIIEAQKTFMSHIDTQKVSLDDMAEVLRSDGVPEDYIATMKANPWEFASGEALVQMAKRAEERKASTQMLGDLKTLALHVKALNAEISRLKGRPSQVLNSVQKHLNQAPPVTSGNARSAADAKPQIDPNRMTIDEINNHLRNSH